MVSEGGVDMISCPIVPDQSVVEEDEKPKAPKGLKFKAKLSCPYKDCDRKTTTRRDLRRHLAAVHGHGDTWYECGHPSCTYRTKRPDHLKRHIKTRGHHSLDTWTGSQILARTQRGVARPGEVVGEELPRTREYGAENSEDMWVCTHISCKFACATEAELDAHISKEHSQDEQWWACSEEGCVFRTKKRNMMMDHLISAHLNAN